MRLGSGRTSEFEDDDFDEVPNWRTRLSSWLLHHPKDAVALLTATAGCLAIAINALFLQSGPHPAPPLSLHTILSGRSAHKAEPLPRRRPAVPIPPPAPAAAQPQARAGLVTAIQRELAKRGFYDGTVDGIYGPKTEAAVRAFGDAAHVKPAAEPSQALLHSIVHSSVKAKRPATTGAVTRPDPIAKLIASSEQRQPAPSSRAEATPPNLVEGVQRALTDFGYGQIRPTGTIDPDTVAAIEKFERSRKLPVTGKITERLVEALTTLTGKPLQ